MLTSCPRVIDLSPTKALGAPQNHARSELTQPLSLSKEKPLVFTEERKES